MPSNYVDTPRYPITITFQHTKLRAAIASPQKRKYLRIYFDLKFKIFKQPCGPCPFFSPQYSTPVAVIFFCCNLTRTGTTTSAFIRILPRPVRRRPPLISQSNHEPRRSISSPQTRSYSTTLIYYVQSLPVCPGFTSHPILDSMKFAREFRTALVNEGYPAHWVNAAIPYGQLKKSIKKVASARFWIFRANPHYQVARRPRSSDPNLLFLSPWSGVLLWTRLCQKTLESTWRSSLGSSVALRPMKSVRAAVYLLAKSKFVLQNA